jgi:uncharacterized protein (DUF433 family)
MNKLSERITINPDTCHGKPCIRNMRCPVEMILDLLSSGMTNVEIIQDYPAVEPEDISACLEFAARMVKIKSMHKIIA